MAKKKSESSVRRKQAAKNSELKSDRDIDYSDIPESSDLELRTAKRVGRRKSATAKAANR